MDVKKTVAYWALNVLPTLWLFLFAGHAFSTFIYLRAKSLPSGIPASMGPLWPAYYLFGSTYPTVVAVVAVLLGVVAAVRYRSRWGAAAAAVSATLTLEHFLILACLRP